MFICLMVVEASLFLPDLLKENRQRKALIGEQCVRNFSRTPNKQTVNDTGAKMLYPFRWFETFFPFIAMSKSIPYTFVLQREKKKSRWWGIAFKHRGYIRIETRARLSGTQASYVYVETVVASVRPSAYGYMTES
jgi:hypothetical protein